MQIQSEVYTLQLKQRSGEDYKIEQWDKTSCQLVHFARIVYGNHGKYCMRSWFPPAPPQKNMGFLRPSIIVIYALHKNSCNNRQIPIWPYLILESPKELSCLIDLIFINTIIPTDERNLYKP